MSTPGNPLSSTSNQPDSAPASGLEAGHSTGYSNQAEMTTTPERNGHRNGEHNTFGREDSPDTRPSSSKSTPSRRSQEQEQGIKVHKTRKSGGFLLSSAFRSSTEPRQHTSNGKGKRKADAPYSSTAKKATPYNVGRLNGSMRSSPLAQVVVSPRPPHVDGSNSRDSSELHSIGTGDARHSYDDQSGDGSRESSGDYGYQTSQAPGGIDPAQIVNMALNLSESRRRNFSAGQLLPPATAGGRRAVSAAIPAPSSNMQGSYHAYGAGGSLRQHLQQQRRISRNHSPGAGMKTSSSRQVSSSYAPPLLDSPGVTPYHFSDATLARAEKAKQYLETSVEFRRLLQYLPPLKPDSTAPGNHYLTTSSVPGTTNVQLNKVQNSNPNERHILGRQYNPLQLIRNRKLRARKRNSLNPDVEHWSNSGSVRDWIDIVEEVSQEPSYRGRDNVKLPSFPLDGLLAPESSGGVDLSGNKVNENATAKGKRPRMDWYTSPFEHLADAYWLEQGLNKSLIENKNHNRIYPGMASSESLDARASFESRRSQTGSLIPSIVSPEKDISDVESHREDERGRKHHLLGHNREDSRGRLKAVFQKARGRSRSSSSGLSSSDDGLSPTRKRKSSVLAAQDDDSIAIGPLELHMNNILNAESTQSPQLISPGTPNKWGIESSEPMSRATAHPETEPPKHSHLTEVTDWSERQDEVKKKHPNNLGQSIPHSNEPRSSFEDDLNSTNPNSPTNAGFYPSSGLLHSPPISRTASPSRKPKLSMLPFIRAEGLSRKSDGQEPIRDDSDNMSSRQTSAEAPHKPRTSLEGAASPNRVKNFFTHKPNDSLNSLSPRPSSRGKDTKETKEPESAVRRFFKGGRLGEIVRNEGAKVGSSFRKKDYPQEETLALYSESGSDTFEDTDFDDIDLKSPQSRPQTLHRTSSATVGQRSNRRGDRPLYHLNNLPSFRPAHAKATSQPTTPSGHDHIAKQQQELRHNRSSRFERLAPPELDLSRVTTAADTSPDLSRTNTFSTPDTSRDDRRSSYGFPNLSRHTSRKGIGNRLAAILDKSGGVGRGGMPPSALTNLEEKSRSRPSLSDKRHWSISDKPRSRSPHPTASSFVNPAEIARIRALLLCSGIKAAEISRRAHSPRDPPLFLRQAASTSGANLRVVPRKEEHVLAARMLTTSLENETSALLSDSAHFHSTTIMTLHTSLSDLKDAVSACVERARNSGDESVRFGAEITGQRTIEVRRVVDALEKLSRARRRRLRWVRRVGFGMVEWGVVAFMWWIWLIVVILRGVWKVVMGTVKVVKWVFWL
jgi:hypothetical protein